jgi:hypothetical protein
MGRNPSPPRNTNCAIVAVRLDFTGGSATIRDQHIVTD